MDPHLWLAGGELHVVVVVIDAVAKLHDCRQVEQGPQSPVDALVHGVASHGCHFPAAAALLSIDFSRHQNTNKPVWSVAPKVLLLASRNHPKKRGERWNSVPEPKQGRNTRCSDIHIYVCTPL